MPMTRIALFLVVGIFSGSFLPVPLLAQPAPATAPAVTNKFYSSSGQWVQVSNTNCVIWSSWPRKGESVTWTGRVVDGKAHGEGTVQWFTNGIPTTAYKGELKGGVADGHGIARGRGEEYEGQWKAGSLVATNGTIKYAGGNWYRGEIKDGFKMGRGEEMMKGGVKYVGEFKYDRFDGEGQLLLPNGDRIRGEWRDSKLQGVGTYHTKGGDSFRVRQT
jgi:hypothetical protein